MLRAIEAIALVTCVLYGLWFGITAFIVFISDERRVYGERLVQDPEGIAERFTLIRRVTVSRKVGPGLWSVRSVVYSRTALVGRASASVMCFVLAGCLGAMLLER